MSIPLFVARQNFGKKRRPRALGPWAIDSGGFTACNNGGWTLPARDFVDEVESIASDVGRLAWAAPQDWMCEPVVLKATGLTVAEHQRRTIANVLEVRSLARKVHFVPVLQGWAPDDYLRCIDLYEAAGINLAAETIVGLGTVCRRQATDEARMIVRAVRARVPGIRLHGFGFKMRGLAALASDFDSADSLAWSFGARFNPPLPGCTHKNCANCPKWALRWRERLSRLVALADEA